MQDEGFVAGANTSVTALERFSHPKNDLAGCPAKGLIAVGLEKHHNARVLEKLGQRSERFFSVIDDHC